MNCLASANETERFRAAIGRQIGLRFDDAKLAFLGQVLQRRLREKGWSSEAYLRELEYQPSGSELSALARELTVGETYFFRNNEQFRALAEVVLPDRMRTRHAAKTLRLLRCDEMQGYLFSKPISLEEMSGLIENGLG